MDNHVSAIVGTAAVISAAQGVDITASSDAELMLAALTIAAAGGSAAVGGTLTVVVVNTVTLAEVGNGAQITSSNGSVLVGAYAYDRLINVLAAASAAGGGTSVAGTLGVLIDLNQPRRASGPARSSARWAIFPLRAGQDLAVRSCRGAFPPRATTPSARRSASMALAHDSGADRAGRAADLHGRQRARAGAR